MVSSSLKIILLRTSESRLEKQIWEAKQKCLGLVLVRADFQKYLRFSRLARESYADYSDKIEPYGIDEYWIDVSGTEKIFGTGQDIANQIRQRLRDKLALLDRLAYPILKFLRSLVVT
ncbi:UMUC domain protein DNA-repair protein [Pelosinus fermentans DSM 17108]|jgi:nucleotidyltransferase/DNA polymerase involved in DNA repair|uniref:UMUC domain protein DNA-repair protein n=1 Tax=Pelosinus fermentans B4 TaxID=1149862 RepID=I8RFN2_9FIRM|nr:UMUC domain protein DNA-repair protein [Pelosinus fermentans B4]EIW24309.1 UMUC domain protein DNA-repair protein [Pelosinus fermentans A11]OAM94245.1 UMUC domain protein DNA-repair protein [Pelosinus fermentans DSM 17108]